MKTSSLFYKFALATCSVLIFTSLTGCDSQTSSETAQNTPPQTEENDSCGGAATLISGIQGNESSSPLVDQTVTIEAVITAIAPQLNGFFVQEESSDSDNDFATSEGIFVFNEQMSESIEIGQLVRVEGTVQEIDGRTQINASSKAQFCKASSVAAVSLDLPLNDVSFESYEGMLIQTSQSWVVNNTYNLSRFGEIGVSANLLFNPTHVHEPGSAEAIALAEANANSRITLDDFNSSAPDSFALYGEFDSSSSLRIGSTLSSIQGVMDESFNTYRLRLTQAPLLDAAERPAPPKVEGDLVIAAFNVLNLFNGDGQNGEFPTRRGAKSLEDYARQQTKLINAIIQLNPDVIGLNEIENDGDQGSLSAISQLTVALNTAFGQDVFDYKAYDSAINGASIANAILFRKDKLEAVGETKVLTSENSALDENGPLFFTEKSRPAITQAFSPIGSEKTFVISVNHLKSKGSSCGEGDDSSDQGNCNLTRTRAAQGLAQWLAEEYADQPIFIIGDLNSYAQEDPIRALKTAGYTDVIRTRNGSQTYTYSFRGQLGALDYVMTNPSADEMVVSAFEWHINAAEPRVLDYNALLPNSEEPKPSSWLSENEFRSSDHDPVVVGISLE